jgi:folate-binding protein YgfZ
MTIEPFATVLERDLVVVRGVDATSFLQSLVSQDLDAVAVGESAHVLLLQPQGKLIVDFNALHHTHPSDAGDEWWCVVESGFGSAHADGLNRFKIRVKVEIELRPVSVLAVRGAAPPVDAHGADIVVVAWNGVAAYDALSFSALRDALALPERSTIDYEHARIEAGVPRLGADIDERTIPQEAGLERDAVSFTKGCFVGQELVCRIDTRGHVNRNLRRLRSSGESLLSGGEVTFDGRPVGSITSAAGDVALAMLRREVEPGATVDANGVAARVEAVFD